MEKDGVNILSETPLVLLFRVQEYEKKCLDPGLHNIDGCQPLARRASPRRHHFRVKNTAEHVIRFPIPSFSRKGFGGTIGSVPLPPTPNTRGKSHAH